MNKHTNLSDLFPSTLISVNESDKGNTQKCNIHIIIN